MAIDPNEEIRIWGGFSVQDFWTGLGVVGAVTAISLLLFANLGGLPALVFFVGVNGPFAAFWNYRRTLPKGYLYRRWKQEGKFLWLKVPGRDGVDVYAPPALGRKAAFEQAWSEDGAQEKH